MRRCKITGNPCGTDTWMAGAPCLCPECQAYLGEKADEAARDLITNPKAYWSGLALAFDRAPKLPEDDQDFDVGPLL